MKTRNKILHASNFDSYNYCYKELKNHELKTVVHLDRSMFYKRILNILKTENEKLKTVIFNCQKCKKPTCIVE